MDHAMIVLVLVGRLIMTAYALGGISTGWAHNIFPSAHGTSYFQVKKAISEMGAGIWKISQTEN